MTKSEQAAAARKDPSDYTVAAVDEAINLLLLVAAEPRLGVTELAKRSGITKARAFRLLTTLEQRALVSRAADDASYSLGYQALHLGAAAQSQIDLARLAGRAIESLGAKFNESIVVRVREGLETVCIARWESTQSLRVPGQIGDRRPLYVGAPSRLLLAYAPQDVIDAVLASERSRPTANTPSSRSKLLAAADKVREQGYAISTGERAADTAAIAVPIRDGSGSVVASLSIVTPVTRMTENRVSRYLKDLQLHAGDLSRALGYVG